MGALMLQNHASIKDSFRVQDRLMDFNVTEYNKFINVVLDSTLQLIFKKPPFIKFGMVSRLFAK